MCKRYMAFIIAAIFVISAIGCGFKNVIPNKAVPPLDGYKTIVIAPYAYKKASTQYKDFPTILSYGVGTKLSVRFPDKTWIYDQSQDLNPVTKKLQELKLSSNDVYLNPEAAAKLAEAFNADMVIAGIMDEPKFTKEESSKKRFDMSESTPTGAAAYYTVYQSIILKTDAKVIDPKTKSVLWGGRLLGYKKYETLFRTGNPPKFIEETTMMADVRKAYSDEVTKKLYP
jgi:hypothetical protein